MRAVTMVLASALALAASGAMASGDGRINFSGAVVAPTCSVQNQAEGSLASCDQAATRYTRKVTQAEQAKALGSELLDYWAEHAPRDAEGKVDATLELRTYL